MKPRPAQFDTRENTASLRRHASPLVINSSNSESLSMDAVERAQSSLRLSPSAKALDLPVTETQNGATGGKEESGMDQRRDCRAQTPFAGGNAKFEPLLECEDAARLLGNIHVKTLQRYARDGSVPGYRIAGRWYFRATELDVWLQSRINSNCQSVR